MDYLDCNQTGTIPRRTSRRKSTHRDVEDSEQALRIIARTSEDKPAEALEVKDHRDPSEEFRSRRRSSTLASRPVEEQELTSLPFVPFDLENTQHSEYLDGGFGWIIVASMSKTSTLEGDLIRPLLQALS